MPKRMSSQELLGEAVDTANEFFGALERREWDTAASMVSRPAQRTLRESQLATLVGWAQHRTELSQRVTTGDESFSWSHDGVLDSTMLSVYGSTPIRAARGIATLAEVGALPAHEFLAWMFEQSLSEPSDTVRDNDASRRVIGAIVEETIDAQFAHVLYRLTGGGFEATDSRRADLLRLERIADRWMIDLTPQDHNFVGGALGVMMIDAGRPFE